MCKIMVIPGIKPTKAIQTKVRKFMVAAQPFMCQFDNDGFGFMAVGDRGLHTEKWLKTEDAFWDRTILGGSETGLIEKYKGFISGGQKYAVTGQTNSLLYSVAMHSRMATCEKSIANTHPFRDGDSALIHNGVISNAKELTFKHSTCDSETILNEYNKCNVSGNVENISEVVYALEGYFACAVFTKIGNQWVLDIFRDDRASLVGVFVHELQTMVFCTTKEIVDATLKKLGWKQGVAYAVSDNMLVRLDAVTGDVLASTEFDCWVRSVPVSEHNISELKTRINGEHPDYTITSEGVVIPKDRQQCETAEDEKVDPYYYEGEGYERYGG